MAAFVGLTGIQAGPIFLSALKEVGIGLFLGGIVVTLLPQLIGLSFGHFTLRMNPIILLGALAGGQTVTAAMAAVQERSGSPVAVLGYTPAYPVANILLTNWGSIIVYRLDVSEWDGPAVLPPRTAQRMSGGLEARGAHRHVP